MSSTCYLSEPFEKGRELFGRQQKPESYPTSISTKTSSAMWPTSSSPSFRSFPQLPKPSAGLTTDLWQRDFGPDKYDTIPPHGRWQHFDVGNVPRVQNMIDSWKTAGTDDLEVTRRLIDLFFVSVLLDAGAGDHWRFIEPDTDRKYERSEGIALASLYMFNSFAFTELTSGKAPLVDGMCCLI